MKLFKILFISTMVILAVSSAATADDFGWTSNFNIQAKTDPPAFREKLAARFDLSDLQVFTLRNIFASPADAYIMLRFSEMQGGLRKLSKKEITEAVKKYRRNRDKGWDEVAESLGVETASKEFLALRHNHDLYGVTINDTVAYSGYARGNDNF